MTNNRKDKPVCNDKIYFKDGMKNIMRYKNSTEEVIKITNMKNN